MNFNEKQSNAADSSGVGAACVARPTDKPLTLTREDWNRRYATGEFVWTVKANRFLMEETAHLSPGTALDLAAGEGRNAVWLAEQGWSVQAVDFSDVGIEKARQLAAHRNLAERVGVQVADLRHFVPEVQRFDLVTLVYLQMPWQDLAPVIAHAARAVAPGGTFLLIGHDPDNLTRGYGGPKHPDVLYSAEQVVSAIGNELHIEKALRVERPVETDDGPRVAIDCLVRARRG